MNKLCGSKAFIVGPTVEACTKGIWVWSEPVRIVASCGTEVDVLFFDTEGIGATGATAEHDARIFSLATMLSSLLIFNSTGPIDEESVQGLAFIANLTRHVQLQLGSRTEQRIVATSQVEDKAVDSGDDSPSRVSSFSLQPSSGHPASIVVDAVKYGTTQDHDSDSDSESDLYIPSLKRAQLKRRAERLRLEASRRVTEQRRAPGLGLGLDRATESANVEVSTFFPTFLWVLRDFSLDLIDDAGQRLTPTEYLESCLRQQDGFNSDVQSRNRTRRLLTGFFKDRHCSTVVRPVEAEDLLQTANTLSDRELRSTFLTEMSALRALVLNDLVRPKTMQGQFLSGRMLVNLTSAYVDAMNHNAVPSIGQAWTDVSKVECKDAFDSSLAKFDAEMLRRAPKNELPLDVDVLTEIFDTERSSALEEFDVKAVGPSAKAYRHKLKLSIESRRLQLFTDNSAASERFAETTILFLWNEHFPCSKYTGMSHDDCALHLSAFKQNYFRLVRGPAIHRVFGLFMSTQLPIIIRAVNAACAIDAERRMANLKRDYEQALDAIEALREENASTRRTCSSLSSEKVAAIVAYEGAARELTHVQAECQRLREEFLHPHSKTHPLIQHKYDDKLNASTKTAAKNVVPALRSDVDMPVALPAAWRSGNVPTTSGTYEFDASCVKRAPSLLWSSIATFRIEAFQFKL